MARVAALTALALSLVGVVLATAEGVGGEEGAEGAARLPGTAPLGAYPALRTVGELRLPAGRARDVGLGVYPALREPAALAFPYPAAVDAARRYAAARAGRIAFAVADRRGGIAGRAVGRRYRSASLVKGMILVAYLDRLRREGRRPTAQETARLDAMIRVSDNDSATSLFRRLGAARLLELARRAGMRAFSVGTDWANAEVTAADQVRFFLALDRLLPAARERAYARYLLSSVMRLQSWGIPAAARPRWRVFFKGGWRPEERGELVHQAGLLERGTQRVAMAILTDRNPSEAYGRETVRGIAGRLLRRRAPAVERARVARGVLAPLPELSGYRPPAPRALRPLASSLRGE